MTTNQLRFHELQETRRRNLENERLIGESQSETKRHNLVGESETARSNIAREEETHRSNVAKETETNRSNLANELLANLGHNETVRSNKVKEQETHRANVAKENETKRHNVRTEITGYINAGNNLAKTYNDYRDSELSALKTFIPLIGGKKK